MVQHLLLIVQIKTTTLRVRREYPVFKYLLSLLVPSVSVFKFAINIRMNSSVSGRQIVFRCLLIAITFNGILTHVTDACQTTNDVQNESKLKASK